ncbi:slr0184 [Synechocystis sp. PCC 6803]|jgi:hypothetical protein|uniref:Slr0184 protein n=1 Tax=Synechocystis sp. (strain ATCC 27184 / PCC 6803 / Kazusa) TaxID=1111708 RepID=Q55573_SYNY3|nr:MULTISPECIES: hypothetical protein [unclassified Synechocystis]BAM54583.1 hypothetical protein BEST7613_5652 [Synechocystis sp. PCC 6803] [Bacillus subtilis BEST7613]AGF52372.1 hypothetical protein MYO_121330 [Synechocystis sp. PCC 6803]ALJ68313.1 hypothetical protein AOY38_10990 [Synechocystis sp. PCC 6803]AVP90153.1 hypothetical protein C7I86_11035 [Synechocystis sp. IPPAS B-1465]MBD2619966.1 hypothetical protein [Synechocystis sp. FACHB-898]
MPRISIIRPEQSYTFSDYFKLNFAPQDILRHFGVTLQRQSLDLPQYLGPLNRLGDLKTRLEESLPRLSLTSEMARREFLIAPVLTDVLHYTHANLDVEYPIVVSNQLKGSLDYLLQNDQTFLVVEAKNEDLERGFVQLAIELIALDQWIESDQSVLQGAISTGNIWQFGQLDRQSRCVTQDLDLYRVPADLEHLLRVLVQILRPVS